jgi:hypothetical protein
MVMASSDDGWDEDVPDDNRFGRRVTVTNGTVVAVPLASNLVVEIVGAAIPGQRADRASKYPVSLIVAIERNAFGRFFDLLTRPFLGQAAARCLHRIGVETI